MRTTFISTIILFLITACGSTTPTAPQVTVTSKVTVTLTPTFTPVPTFTPTPALPPAIAEAQTKIQQQLGADHTVTYNQEGKYLVIDGSESLHIFADHVEMTGNTFTLEDGVERQAIAMPEDIKMINGHKDTRGFWYNAETKTWEIDRVARPAMGTSVETMAATLPVRTIDQANPNYKAMRETDRRYNDLALAAENKEKDVFEGVKLPEKFYIAHEDRYYAYPLHAIAQGGSLKNTGYTPSIDNKSYPTRLLQSAFVVNTGKGIMIDYIVGIIRKGSSGSNRIIQLFDGLEPAEMIVNGTSSVKLVEAGTASPTIAIYDGKATRSVQMIPEAYQKKTEFIADLQAMDATLGLFMSGATTNGFDIQNIPEVAEDNIFALWAFK